MGNSLVWTNNPANGELMAMQSLSRKLWPVIHHRDNALTIRNAELAAGAGAHGVFVISMDGRDEKVIPAALCVKRKVSGIKVGVNLLQASAYDALMSASIAGLDATWVDYIDFHGLEVGPVTRALAAAKHASGEHSFFAGVAFKYQPHEPDPAGAAKLAAGLGFIPTTSGPATGRPAETSKLGAMRAALGSSRLALASGITPSNISEYFPSVTDYLVATGISSDPYTFDQGLLSQMQQQFTDH